MTELTTTHLKCLLEQASPGPWRFSEDIADTLSGAQEIGHEVYAEEKCLFGVWNEPVMDEYPGNLKLAAHAPELAQEVIRLREELRGLRDHLKKKSEYHSKVELSTDPLDGIELEDNYAEDEISRILGDHDE